MTGISEFLAIASSRFIGPLAENRGSIRSLPFGSSLGHLKLYSVSVLEGRGEGVSFVSPSTADNGAHDIIGSESAESLSAASGRVVSYSAIRI